MKREVMVTKNKAVTDGWMNVKLTKTTFWSKNVIIVSRGPLETLSKAIFLESIFDKL